MEIVMLYTVEKVWDQIAMNNREIVKHSTDKIIFQTLKTNYKDLLLFYNTGPS